jgi:uncharacterized protein HemX
VHVNATIAEAIALLALLALSAGGGYMYRGEKDAASVTTATSNVSVCQSTADAKQAALDTLGAKFADLQTRHEAAMKASTDVLDARAEEIAGLQAKAASRINTARKSSHDDPDCVSLSTLPVCTAVAGQLWPAAAQAPAAAHPS